MTENDANCFCLSEAFDGSASHYETVFGIILGSGCGGGLVINKRIISGANGLGGEWSLNQMPIENVKNLKSNKVLDFSNRIEGVPYLENQLKKDFIIITVIKFPPRRYLLFIEKKKKNQIY